jgi:hypothetical protein
MVLLFYRRLKTSFRDKNCLFPYSIFIPLILLNLNSLSINNNSLNEFDSQRISYFYLEGAINLNESRFTSKKSSIKMVEFSKKPIEFLKISEISIKSMNSYSKLTN